MYKIILVGIPIRECDISDDFKRIINEIKYSNSIGITTVDYFDDNEQNIETHIESISSPAGHKLIFDNLKLYQYKNKFISNSINTIGSLWSSMPRCDKNKITETLIQIIDKEYETLKFENVYIFSTGSPYFMNMFTDTLKQYKNIEVIDTKSSFDICKESMYEVLGYKPNSVNHRYNYDFILKRNSEMDLKNLNIFSSISNNYNWNIEIPLVEHFFRTMDKYVKPSDTFMYSTVTKDYVETKKIRYCDAEVTYNNLNKNIPFIIGITKGEI